MYNTTFSEASQVANLTCRIAIAFWQTNNDKIMPLFKCSLFSARPSTKGQAAIEITKHSPGRKRICNSNRCKARTRKGGLMVSTDADVQETFDKSFWFDDDN